MSAGGISSVLAHPLPRTVPLAAIPPALFTRAEPARRTKIWEFSTNLHCSIIGTCLSTGELRQVLRKLDLAPPDSTDHELHATAVNLAGRHDNAAKLLNKALDTRHKLAVNQFAKVDTEDAVRTLWRDAVRRGEIPGAYWAALTHPAATRALVREAFGEVHMLSHLVGSANRDDIQRLCLLEAEKANLQEKLQRQQHALHEAVVARNQRIQALSDALTQKIAADPMTGDSAVLHRLVADLERRLVSETRRRATAETRLTAAQADAAAERAARVAAKQDNASLRRDLDALIGRPCETDSPDAEPQPRLDGVALLYVGGRPHQVAHLRAASERFGATFLHHDGGIENQTNLLPGLTSRADLVLFPVDCISHEAALTVKSLCRQGGKRFIPLRSASVTALLAALRRSDLTGLADAAD